VYLSLGFIFAECEQQDEGPVPFSFHVALPEEEVKTGQINPSRIVVTKSIEADVLNHPSGKFTPEDTIVVHCSPQSVFRVRPATRCSSTLSGWLFRFRKLITYRTDFDLGHSSPILCASFSPTGKLLATGSGDTNARLWDLNTETPSHTLSGHKGWVLCVEWEPMERKLASGGHDGHVRIWDPKTGKAIGDALRGHTKWITSLAWEPIHMWVSSWLYLSPTVLILIAVAIPQLLALPLPQKMALSEYGLSRHEEWSIHWEDTLPASML